MIRRNLLLAAAIWTIAANGFAQSNATIEALQRAVAASPSDASAYVRLSQAYAAANYPDAALSAIEGALALAPDVAEHLHAKAILATWAGKYATARDAYKRLRQLNGDDPAISLGLARVSAWAGETDEAVDAYRRYLSVHPEDSAVWVELARAESWRGNFAAALDVLDDYRDRFGATREYTRERAAVLARGGRPSEAIRLSTPLPQEPHDYRDSITRTIALAMRQQSREALESLDGIRRSHPDMPETHAAERVVHALVASIVEPRATIYNDSDSLQVARLAPWVNVALTTGTQIRAGYEHEALEAGIGSGLEQVGGTPDARHEHVWFGAAQRFSAFTVRGRVGFASSVGHDVTTYALGLHVRPADTFAVSLDRSSGLLAISPRTLGLGLTRLGHQLRLEWQPTLRVGVELEGAYETFSDGNERWEIRFAPRRSVARTQRLNLDLGLSVYQLGTSLDLDNGYYDPRRYENYSLTALPYLKVSENVGLGAVLAVGAQRDDRSPSFRLGANVAAEATFGIYEPWVLKIGGSVTTNQRLDSGAFKGYGGSVSLMRRF
ncbi:MAG TPA: tetratricopeptide repeat protein [Vicinamibacterales bacterium]|nr:tetratricopeptide repeat protein [Vicinamibacterales bacterium]